MPVDLNILHICSECSQELEDGSDFCCRHPKAMIESVACHNIHTPMTWTELDELSAAGVTLCGVCDFPLGTNMDCTTCAEVESIREDEEAR